MIKRLLHTRYRVTDLEKTVAFYRDVLGLEETRRHTSGRGSQLVFFKAPGSEEEIEICKFDGSGPVNVGHDITHLAFEVDDIDAVVRELASRGVAFDEYETPKTVNFIAQVGPARGAWFKDPDGNVFGVREGPVPAG